MKKGYSMKLKTLICATTFALSACGQTESAPKSDANGGAASASKAAPADSGSVCDRYVVFVKSYAAKQTPDVSKTLLDRLNYDEQNWKRITKEESEAYCTQSLARMERLTG
jgi:hypothetical protein